MTAQLSTYKRLLSKYCTKLETVIARFKSGQLETIKFPDQETSPHIIRESHRRLEEGIGAIETCNTKIQELLQNYALAIDKCESLSEKESEDFEEYTSKGETVLCASLDYIVLLKARANAFISYTPTRFANTENNTSNEITDSAIGIKKMELPTLPIPVFHGDLWDWDNFWALFDTNVNSQPLPELYKFNYLLKALRGEPLQAVKKFRVSQDNYAKAINFLKTKYGDNEQLVNRLYGRLEKIQLTSPTIRDQRKLLEQVQAIVAQLQEKNEHVDNQCIIKQVLSKFPIRLQRKVLERKYIQTDNTFGMETLLKLLEEFITTEEKVSFFTREGTPRQHPESHTLPKGKEELSKWINKCMYCGEDHKSIACSKYTTPHSRTQYLREHKLCFICASPKHITADCKKRMCFECQGPHHTSCCFKKEMTGENRRNTYQKTKETKPKESRNLRLGQTKSSSVTPAKIHQTSQKIEDRETTICELQTSNQASRTSSTYLPTGEIQVMNPVTRNLRKIPVLLDTGAELSFIDKNLAEELHLPTIETTRLKLRTFGSEKVNESLGRKVELEAWDAEGNAYQLQLLTYDTLTKPLKTPPLLEKDMQFMQSLNLKSTTTRDHKPLILLGCDQLWQLIKEDTPHVKLPSGLHLLPTKLGHLITGQVQKEHQIAQVGKEDTDLETWDKYWALEAQVNGISEEEEDGIENEEKQKWEAYWMMEKEGTEEFASTEKDLQAQVDQQVWNNFRNTIQKREDGYYVRLPWRKIPTDLPDNKPIAFRRLISVWNSLQKDPQLLEQYHEVFQNQLEANIIEEVEDENKAEGPIIHYIPHQAVITPQKSTTKLRIVFDASAHFKNKPSLNEALFRGPVILPKLFGILLRFRMGDIAMISDVEKAFLQVRLHEEDRDATRCLWLSNHHEPPNKQNLKIFRFTRVTFGLLCSPFLLAATTHYHLDQYKDNLHLIQEIKQNLYVDNLILTMNNPKEAIRTYRKTKMIFNDLQMNLREFGSNCKQAISKMNNKDRSSELITKVLGIKWNTQEDTIEINCSVGIANELNKRKVASAIAAIYDPMGWLLPLVHRAKVYLQTLWKEQIGWDETLSEEHQTEWKGICQRIQGFHKILSRELIPRGTEASIISFADASTEAMAACAYIKTDQKIQLLMAKGKLPSIKSKSTIPKMELNAVTLAMRLTNAILEQVKQVMKVKQVIVFIDSEIALSWMTTQEKTESSPFIKNRIGEIRRIREHLENAGYKVYCGHISTQLNPADCATRGATKEELQEHWWWTGPDFLLQPQGNWPTTLKKIANEATEGEEEDVGLENEHSIQSAIQENTYPKNEDIFKNIQARDFTQLKRIVAYILRFINITINRYHKRNPNKITLPRYLTEEIQTSNQILTGKEIALANKVLIRQHQQTMLTPNIRQSCHRLNLKKDKDGIYRCMGRLADSCLENSAKFPIFVLQNTWLARFIIQESHEIGHKSTSHTMATVRQKYWIPKLRAQVTKFIRKCIPCQKMNNLPYKYPEQSNLPVRRIQRSYPFENIGLDYFGPISITNEGGNIIKGYGVIITCLVTRLMHLDLVKDGSTEAFLNMLRRFFARRGTPKSITSDNAPTFILGDTILKECHHNAQKNPAIAKEISKREIEWRYITPYAPWQGGVYERLIKSVKLAMHKTLGKTTPMFDELETIIIEIESMLNTRPLTYIESETTDDRILRPIDFLQNEFHIPIPLDVQDRETDDPDFTTPEEQARLLTKTNVMQAIQSSCKLTETYWHQWQYEYLTALRETHKREVNKKRSSKDIPHKGKVVLIADALQPRHTWKLGRIEELVPNKDGVAREAVVKLPSQRKIRRPINLLIPLELEREEHRSYQQEIEELEEKPQPSDTSNQRYNLRPRTSRKMNETIKAINFNISTMLTIILTSLISGVNVKATDQVIRCTQEGVEIQIPQITPYQICVEDFCKTLEHPKLHEVLKLPPQITLHEHTVHWKIGENSTITTVETICPATSFCANIDCTLCATLVLNPECWPVGAIIVSGLMLYLLCIGCYAFLYVPIIIGRPLRVVLSAIWATILFIRRKSRRFRYGPRRTATDLIELFAVLAMVTTETSSACQQINIFSHQSTICTETSDSNQMCKLQLSEVLKINPFKREACFRLTKNGTSLHEIHATWKSLILTCEQTTDFYTRQVSYNVIDSKRCPHVGTCVEPKCAAINGTSLIPELEQGNKYPGVTYCVESCGGPGCDCFYWSSGCLFYRIYFIPLSAQIFRVFHCNRWKEAAKVELVHIDAVMGKSQTYLVNMQPNIPVKRGPFSLTLSSVTIPPIPLLNTYFITNNNETALWDRKLTPPLFCVNQEAAETLDCEVRDDCTCYPAETRANCKCKEVDISSAFNDLQRRLPAEMPSVSFKQNEQGKVQATVTTMTTSEIILNIQENLKTKIVVDQVFCTVTNTILTGCYNCAKGATAQISCVAAKQVYAEITCGESSFTVACDKNGKQSTLRFSPAQARVHMRCMVNCGGEPTSFEIAGILKYTNTAQDIIQAWLKGTSNEYQEIKLPDFPHIFDVFLQCNMSHLEELTYLTDKIAPRVTVTIPMLEEDLQKTSEELQRQVDVIMTINQDWNCQKTKFFKQAPTEQIVTISRLVRAAAAAKDSYLKLCTRYILTAKWMEKFPRIEENPQSRRRVWLDDITSMDMNGQMKKMERVIEKLEKEERIIAVHLQNRTEDFYQAKRDHIQICTLQERLREAEMELFYLKAKRARIEMGTEMAPHKTPEKRNEKQLTERKETTQAMDIPRGEETTQVMDIPRLVDDEEEEMEPEDELMVIDEEEVGEGNSARQRQEEVLDDEGYLAQLLQETGETPQEVDEPSIQLLEEVLRSGNVVIEQAEVDTTTVQIQEQRPQAQVDAENRDNRLRQGQNEIQELQNHIQELEARIQVTLEENQAREEEVYKLERAIQVLPRRLLQDAPERITASITCAFCKARGRHFSDSCYVITDGDERYNLALEEGLCHRCLLRHGGRCWNPFRPCFYCEKVAGTVSEEFCPRDEDHHKALCPIPNAEDKLQQRIRRAMDHYIEVGQDIERMKEQRDDLKNQVEQILRQDPTPHPSP